MRLVHFRRLLCADFSQASQSQSHRQGGWGSETQNPSGVYSDLGGQQHPGATRATVYLLTWSGQSHMSFFGL